MAPSDTRPHPLLLAAGSAAASQTGQLLQATDWSATALGPIERWPQSLRIAVSICLNSRFPMFVWWGPELVNIYNDAYIPVMGQRHPRGFGQPARATWHEIWDVLGPQQEAVMLRGEATWNERVLLVMERNGFPEPTYFTWSYSPIHREDGRIGGLFCACTEETAHVAAERERDELVESAQNAARTLQTWFDNAPGFVALLGGPDHVFEMVNKAYLQLVGHRDIVGKPMAEALPEVVAQGFDALLDEVFATGQPYFARAMRVRLQMEPGAPLVERFLDLVYQPVRETSGAVVGVFAQGHDVTEQVTASQALREADLRKDEFLATLAHELRNPLAPVRQAARLARIPELDEARREWALDVIERQVSRMTLLIDDLLDVSRISRGKLELRLTCVDLRQLVASMVETAAPGLQAKAHALQLRLPPGPVRVQADPVRLEQVVSNLLSNARKYTDPGGRIEVELTTHGHEAVLCVRDSGIGLSEGDRNRIFGMFSQVRSAIDRAEGGLGIGLALSRGLVHLHGGRIDVHSEGPGRGSEFVVRLPLQPDGAADTPVPLPESAPLPRGDGGELSLLLADDNLDALETLAMLLEAHGYVVHTAQDGEQALAKLRQLRPQVGILDIGMPGMNGYEVARRFRAAEPDAPVRLVALTGWGQAQDQARALNSGFDFHCTKPVDVHHLLELIQQAGTAVDRATG
ncbi:response regulator [Ramlibacter sp. AW1]|uniref:histidine kinase n=1 Tax=Ramlibacter aurantiacus TaxID=2801330 RepID=A0A937D2Y8_9BURK|nr:ATP-binding protein [Ramlibacter aurantiacus]MBL0420200.1 response regulator [Ramlibacter aurantiacus]